MATVRNFGGIFDKFNACRIHASVGSSRKWSKRT